LKSFSHDYDWVVSVGHTMTTDLAWYTDIVWAASLAWTMTVSSASVSIHEKVRLYVLSVGSVDDIKGMVLSPHWLVMFLGFFGLGVSVTLRVT